MDVSPLWMVSFAALWALVALVAVAQALVIRYAVRLERELLDAGDGPEVGARVAGVELRDLSGRGWNLIPAAGRRAAVFFMSPACPACGQVSRALRALPDIAPMDLLVVCQASEEAARRYAGRQSLFLPVLPDPEGAAMRALRVTGVPFALVLDASGRVERKGVPVTYRDMLELLGAPEEEDAQDREGLPAPLDLSGALVTNG
jgi:hypothetical protein